MRKGFLYLMAIMDRAMRRVLAWRLSNTLDADFCVEALNEALSRFGPPRIFNTDQGRQFTSFKWVDTLSKAGIKISMDGKGRFMDNIFIERLWRLLKYECVYLHAWSGGREAKAGIGKWIDFYNTQRPHSGHKGLTPDVAYWTDRQTDRQTETGNWSDNANCSLKRGSNCPNIGDHLRQSGVEDLGTYMLRRLAFRQAHHDGTSRCVDNRMKFGVQPAFGAPDAAGNIPFLSRLEAVRCALRCVASNHKRVRRIALCASVTEYLVKNTHFTPAFEPVVQGLVRPVFRRGIPPTQAVFDDKDNPRNHFGSSTRGTPWAKGKNGSILANCSSDNQNKSRIAKFLLKHINHKSGIKEIPKINRS